jgi:acyl-CoA synthetase (NDP forming)
MLTGVTMAGNASGAGFNLLISCGNEAVTDMADFVEYLADEPATKAIGLIMEKIRRPREFFAAVARAIDRGKPVVAVKLARTERTQRMAASHTGSLTGDPWVYDVALRQHGVAIARDAEELADRLVLIDKIPQERWSRVEALAVVTMTGGYASQAYDIATEEGVRMAALEDLLPRVRGWIPSAAVANPLDMAGGGYANFREILETYITSPEVDAFFLPRPMTEREERVRSIAAELGDVAKMAAKPVVLSNISGPPPDWVAEYESTALAFGNGVRPTLRGLDTIGKFVRYRERRRPPVEQPRVVARPSATTISTREGEMLPFDVTMRLLRDAGVPVAPYALIEEVVDARSVAPEFAEPYVAKLANVAHRTDLDAVRLNVRKADVPRAIAELRTIARAEGLPSVVALQPMLPSNGELLIGIHGTSELGPLVVFGLGGVFVEALNRVGGRLAPFDIEEARDLIEEFRDVKVMHGFRGRAAWDLDALARMLTNVSRLAAAGREWISSLDINPVLYDEAAGYAAVDALLFVRS